MPTNTPIPTKSVGNVLAAADWNYLTALNGGLGLLGAVGPLVGTLPPVTAPNFQIQAGRMTVTCSAANFSFSWPTAFPNGLLAVFMQGEASGSPFVINNSPSSTKSSAVGQLFVSGAAFTGSSTLHFLAIGF